VNDPQRSIGKGQNVNRPQGQAPSKKDGIANFICSKDVLAVLPKGFGKSLFQLIPRLCVELHSAPDTGAPDELEQHFNCLLLLSFKGKVSFCNILTLNW